MSPTDSPGLLLRAVRRLLALHADWGLETYPQTPGLTAFLAPRPQAPPPWVARPAPCPSPFWPTWNVCRPRPVSPWAWIDW